MSKDERDFLDALRARSIEAAAEILQGVQRLKSMSDEVTDDGTGSPLPRPRIADHFYQLAKFELEHASTLIRLGNSQAEMIFDHLRQLARRTQKSSSPVLLLEPTESDDKCIGRFEVRNPFEKVADLRFESDPLQKADGTVISDARLDPDGRLGAKIVRGHDSLVIEVSTTRPAETLFGHLRVYLSADIEKQVARRLVKVRSTKESP